MNKMQEQDKKIAEKLSGIKHKIMVMSGKGGVGKSTTAANIAMGLARKGYRVGILDTDLHGPSITKILGIENQSIDLLGDEMLPVQHSKNLFVISIQFMLEKLDTAVIWRGPLKIGAIKQFISDVVWENFDYLVIDSPPGTGDEPLTVAQTIKDCEAIIVTTPQKVAISDVEKSINFLNQLHIKILGILENMSGFVCPHCGNRVDIFKNSGGLGLSKKYNIPFLGSVPIDMNIVAGGDDGRSIFDYKDSIALESINKIVQGIENHFKNKENTYKKDQEKELKTNNEISKTEYRIALPSLAGKFSAHFGHADQFAFVTIKDNEVKDIVFINTPEHQPGTFPKFVSENNARIVLAGGMGNSAKQLFEEKGIEVITGVSGDDPAEIVKEYLMGSLVRGEEVCDNDGTHHH